MRIRLLPTIANPMLPLISDRAMAQGLFHGLIKSPKLMIKITAYLDDSGTHDPSDVVVVAGFLGSDDDWLKFKPEWMNRLAQDEVKQFHMTDCVNGTRDFAGLPQSRRDLLIDDLCSILGAQDLLGISAAMLRKDWGSVVVTEFPDILDVLHSPYYTLSSSFIQQAVRHTIDKFDGNESLSVIYGCRPQDSAKQRALPDLYKAHAYWGQSIIAITPGVSEQFAPLQAADLFANELYRNHVDRMRNPATFKVHQRLVTLRRNAPLAGNLMNRDALRHLCAQFRDLMRRAATDPAKTKK